MRCFGLSHKLIYKKKFKYIEKVVNGRVLIFPMQVNSRIRNWGWGKSRGKGSPLALSQRTNINRVEVTPAGLKPRTHRH